MICMKMHNKENRYMKNKLWWISLCLMASLYGCDSDDDSGNTNQGNGNPPCDTEADCESGVCIDNKCAIYVSTGETCDTLHLCASTDICKEGLCTTAGTQAECTGSGQSTCAEGKVCVENRCEDIVYLDEGEPCTTGNAQKVCQEPYICYEGTCSPHPTGNGCSSDKDCADQEVFKSCMDGACVAVVSPGEICDQYYVCPESYTCYSSICTKIVALGDACNPSEYINCDIKQNQTCYNGTCHEFGMNADKGSTCNELIKCSPELICKNQVCMTAGAEGDACNEEELNSCGENMMCILNECVPSTGKCKTSADCVEKDSYCCQKSSCGAIGSCIPYDETTTHDEMCMFKTKPGIFEAQIQCRWQPPQDANPESSNVEIPPLVGKFGNNAGVETAIAVWSYEPTVLRLINPETCETLESLKVDLAPRWYNFPAAADLDGDGLMEIITGTDTKTYIYKWDPKANKNKGAHVLKSEANVDYRPMSLLFDINNDGNTEIIGSFGSVISVNKSDLSMEVLANSDLFIDGSFLKLAVGAALDGYYNETGQDAAIGNLDGDTKGFAELVTAEGLYTWDDTNKQWQRLLTFPWHSTLANGWVRQFPAYADFGIYNPQDDTFTTTKLDGIPEIVISGKDQMNLFAIFQKDDGSWDSKNLMQVSGFTRGGPVTIGDFNNDGLPEIGIASNGYFGVYDPKCTAYQEGKCADKYVMWERWSQDNSSGTTGSSLFDFDGDGQAEAVYADECFTRVYDGKTGAILFSAKRSSNTSIEGPVIADIDNDGSTEIIMGSDTNMSCYNDDNEKLYPEDEGNNAVDPIHEGIRCISDEDCPTQKNCDTTIGFCTCTTDDECNTQFAPGKSTYLQQYVCAPPIHSQVGFMINDRGAKKRQMAKPIGTRPAGWKAGDYQVCRATRKTTDIGIADLMIFKDRLDRWVSSRNLWNQHAYNILNIKDDGKVPSNAAWLKSWRLKETDKFIEGTKNLRAKYNSYRMNEQGLYGAGAVPDITGRFVLGNICGETDDGRKVIAGKLCNRGTKPAATNLPATFFHYDESAPDKRGEKICTSYTEGIVDVGQCMHVGCSVEESVFDKLQGKKVLMVTNLNEHGFASTIECNSTNNTDTILIEACEGDIEIVN